MTDCKHCEHAFCEYAGMERGFKVKCANYVPPRKPQTNADRIRAMSDEELEQAFYGGGLCSYIQGHDKQWCDDMPDCGNCVIQWLRQPVKDGDNDG